MKILNLNQKRLPSSRNSVIAIGNFDGLHIGHLAIIKQLTLVGKKDNLTKFIILFEPQPNEVIDRKYQSFFRISTLRYKVLILKRYNIDRVGIIKFRSEVANLKAADFIEMITNQLHIKSIVVGRDFKLGSDQKNIKFLESKAKELGYNLHIIDDVCNCGLRVSSSEIRNLLMNSQFSKIKTFLNRDYALCGRVIRGEGIGRRIGIPTANLLIANSKFLLRGVFICRVNLATEIKLAIANIGLRPTFKEGLVKPIFEVHLIDFSANIYGRWIIVEFLAKIREERYFTNLQDLVLQINRDILEAKKWLEINENGE